MKRTIPTPNCKPFPILLLLTLVFAGIGRASAATLAVAPHNPQPGDVLTLTLHPAPGEIIAAASMTAFDTSQVKFYPRRDGSLRAFLGFPFDRNAGGYTLRARVRLTRAGSTVEETPQVRMEARPRRFPTQSIHMRPSMADRMREHAAFRAERRLVQSTMQNSYGAPLWRGSWLIPARGQSTSSYGRRRFVNGKPWGQHNGADIRAPTGAPVAASNDGRVVLSRYLPTLRGNCIVIDHGCNVFSVYMHLSQRLVQAGDRVGRGQLIGRVGATGFVTGPHLHWEIRIGWEPVDPFKVARNGLEF